MQNFSFVVVWNYILSGFIAIQSKTEKKEQRYQTIIIDNIIVSNRLMSKKRRKTAFNFPSF